MQPKIHVRIGGTSEWGFQRIKQWQVPDRFDGREWKAHERAFQNIQALAPSPRPVVWRRGPSHVLVTDLANNPIVLQRGRDEGETKVKVADMVYKSILANLAQIYVQTNLVKGLDSWRLEYALVSQSQTLLVEDSRSTVRAQL